MSENQLACFKWIGHCQHSTNLITWDFVMIIKKKRLNFLWLDVRSSEMSRTNHVLLQWGNSVYIGLLPSQVTCQRKCRVLKLACHMLKSGIWELICRFISRSWIWIWLITSFLIGPGTNEINLHPSFCIGKKHFRIKPGKLCHQQLRLNKNWTQEPISSARSMTSLHKLKILPSNYP